jgi:oligosaccharyltransferase complex subunit delta (ribophorin II)
LLCTAQPVHAHAADQLLICMLRRFTAKNLPKKPVSFGAAENFKLVITATEDGKGKRPHQAFLVLKETESGLEAPFPLTTKDSGKAVIDIVRPGFPRPILNPSPGWQV